MEPRPPDESPLPDNESRPPALKSYAAPKLTEHGKLPALTLGGSLTDNDNV